MIESAIMISVIMALSEMIKRLDKVNVKYIPLLNLALGIVFSFVYSGADWKTGIFQGIIVGLSASGLYSGVKNVSQGVGGEQE